MPEIDLNVDFEDVKHADEFPVVPNGTYTFIVKNVDATDAKSSGRPMLKWTIAVPAPETGRDCNVFCNTVLPYKVNDELIVSGIFQLVSICKAVGMPWTGGKLITENYIGRSGRVIIKQVPAQSINPLTGEYEADLTKPPRNDVEKFLYDE